MITRTWLTGVALVMMVVCGASLYAPNVQGGASLDAQTLQPGPGPVPQSRPMVPRMTSRSQ